MFTYADSGTSTGDNASARAFKATGSIAKGDLVQFDTGVTDADERAFSVKKAVGVATHGSSFAFGVALHAAVAGEYVRVCVGGFCAAVKVPTSTAAGVQLVGPIGTDGQAAAWTAGTTESPCFGVVLAAEAGGLAPVMVYRKV